jgi:hypothetical protein
VTTVLAASVGVMSANGVLSTAVGDAGAEAVLPSSDGSSGVGICFTLFASSVVGVGLVVAIASPEARAAAAWGCTGGGPTGSAYIHRDASGGVSGTRGWPAATATTATDAATGTPTNSAADHAATGAQ